MFFRRWTLDVGRWTLDVGRWTLDAGRWTLDAGRWTLDVGRWMLDAGIICRDAILRVFFLWQTFQDCQSLRRISRRFSLRN